jgi:hypothetical protein
MEPRFKNRDEYEKWKAEKFLNLFGHRHNLLTFRQIASVFGHIR